MDKFWRDPLIPRHGGYRRLKSFQVAQSKAFASDGGFSERLYRVRRQRR